MDANPLNKVQVMSAFGSNLESDNMMAFDSSKDKARLETDQDDGRIQTDQNEELNFFQLDAEAQRKHVRSANPTSLPSTIRDQYGSLAKSLNPSLDHLDQTFAKMQDALEE